jgi:hypothetical protein
VYFISDKQSKNFVSLISLCLGMDYRSLNNFQMCDRILRV